MIDFKTLLFPRRCPVCDRPVKPAGALVCRSCAPKLVYVRQPLCMKCGKELSDENQEYCRDCLHKKHLYDRGISLYRYTSVKKAVYRFKYAGRQEYAAFFGKEMAWHLGRQILSWKVDALVPVPLHPARKRKRGYNQAELLALEIGKQLGLRVENNWLIRTKNTVPQKLLNGQERRNNLKKAFKAGQNDVKLNAIVIIDDIYTTGSTIDAMAAVCRQQGVSRSLFCGVVYRKRTGGQMINQEKVLRMTKMASYEEHGGRKDRAVVGYFRSDYIGKTDYYFTDSDNGSFPCRAGGISCISFFRGNGKYLFHGSGGNGEEDFDVISDGGSFICGSYLCDIHDPLCKSEEEAAVIFGVSGLTWIRMEKRKPQRGNKR